MSVYFTRINRIDIYDTMNCYSSVSQYIYIHIGSTVVEDLVCYERGSWFETSDQQGFFFLFGIFNVQTDL